MNTDKKIPMNYDAQGFPEYGMSLADLFVAFGAVYNKETNTWTVPNIEKLDSIFPQILEDDGMGYSPVAKYIHTVDLDLHGNEPTCSFWVDVKMENAKYFADLGLHPGEYVTVNDKTYSVAYFKNNEDGSVSVVCYEVMYNETAKCDMPSVKNGKTEFDYEQFKKSITKN